MTTTPSRTTATMRRFGFLSAADVGALDESAAQLGVDVVQLMEAAGIQVARLAWRMVGGSPARLHVVAGRGHNGADGLVAARHLSSWGCAVSAVLVSDPDRVDDLLLRQCAAARGAGVAVEVNPAPGRVPPADVALTVDALLGTGLRTPPRPPASDVIPALTGRVLSVDVPSGLDATTGTAAGVVVRAEATVTFGGCKLGFWQAGARAFTGQLYIADIGLPPEAWRRCGIEQPIATRGGLLRRVPMPR